MRQSAPGRLAERLADKLTRRVAERVRRTLARRAGRQAAAPIYTGNRVELLVDGPATFGAMFEAIETASESIFLESYIIEDAAIAQRMAEILLRKRAAGVTVHVLYDAVGSLSTSEAFFERLRRGGIEVCEFNPINPFTRHRWLARVHLPKSSRQMALTQRDHRKILTIDSRVAFTGGINISEVYSSGSFGVHPHEPPVSARDGWRDTQVRIEGPAALALESLVREAWVSQGCGHALPPPAPAAAVRPAEGADKLVAIVAASPQDRRNRIYDSILSAIREARRSVHLTMAYFAPGQQMIDALCAAARRGVDVTLVLPSVSDFAPVLHAGRSYYRQLLAAGVRLHELQHAVLHAKTAVVDGVFTTVGSSNLDWRSLRSTNEINAVIFSEQVGGQMEAIFARDLEGSQRINAAEWRLRPWTQKLKEWAARSLENWW